MMTGKSLKRIFWFAYYNCQSPSVRYRAHFPLLHLRENFGIKTYLIIPGYHPARIMKFLAAFILALFSSSSDLIVIQRVSTNWIYSNALKFLARTRKNVVYDLDDADYLVTDPDSIYTFARSSSRVIAGSELIAHHLAQHNQKITVNTSPVPTALAAKSVRNGKFVIGWIGEFGGDHKTSLYTFLFPAVARLQFPVRLILMGVIDENDRKEIRHYFQHAERVELQLPESIDWMNEEFIQQEISKFDAGIATLMNSEMHRSKSGFKVKQYLNNGVPVLCNDLRENNRYVVDHHNGFLCNSSAEFYDRLCYLRHLDELSYTRLSLNASASIAPFTLDKYCQTLCDLN